MDRENAINYLRSSGFSEEQINEIEKAFTCEDAISRQAALDLCERFDGCVPYSILSNYDMLPSVSTEKVGRWKRRIVDSGYNADWSCSCCGYKVKTDFVNFKYCPNCGARMGVEE